MQPVSVPKAVPKHVTASWYGPGLDGHKTSSGETYNQNELTAASKTLPIGSHVIVKNPKNGKSVEVRINDRGPHVRGRSLDLSKRAAQKLGITDKGVARVEVIPAAPKSHSRTARAETAPSEPDPPAAAPSVSAAPAAIAPTPIPESHI